MDQQKQQLIDRIKQAQNVLVTVSSNPSVDQLSAAIGLTIALNKLDKHGTAVFSGQVPSTIEFLKPEETLEKNTDSLRDFIIALDKSKADKLRYKVEDQVVRIFITPYRTSLSEKDLEFSQGDFNVDVVVALGVASQQDLDQAITAHGRILHDATVASVSVTGQGELGTINWVNTGASSLSEMMLSLVDGLDKSLLDSQIATALLTGIVATTDRFRNEKTSPETMQVSAELMSAGANQQLIATELETPPPAPERPQSVRRKDKEKDDGQSPPPEAESKEPGELDINHEDDEPREDVSPEELRAPEPEPDLGDEPDKPAESSQPQIDVDEDGKLSALPRLVSPDEELLSPLPKHDELLPQISKVHGVETDGRVGEPGTPEVRHERLSGEPSFAAPSITANVKPDDDSELPTEELSLPPINGAPLLSHNESVLPPPASAPTPTSEDTFLPQAPWPAAPPPLQAPAVPAMPVLSSSPVPVPMPPPAPSLPPLPPAPVAPPAQSPWPPVSPASASLRPGETLEEIEEAVHSPHLQQPKAAASTSVDDARNAVQAALGSIGAPAADSPLPPITALNALPLGNQLHVVGGTGAVPAVPVGPVNPGFSEPTPGNTPADATLDMPLPSSPFGPGQRTMPPLPPAGAVPASGGAPPVPPPFVPPLP